MMFYCTHMHAHANTWTCRDKKAAKSPDMLGQDHSGSRKALPKALPPPSSTPHPPSLPGKEKQEKGKGEGGEGEGEAALTKAQLKRRKKKAAQKAGSGEGSPPLEGGGAKEEGDLASKTEKTATKKSAGDEKGGGAVSMAKSGSGETRSEPKVVKAVKEELNKLDLSPTTEDPSFVSAKEDTPPSSATEKPKPAVPLAVVPSHAPGGVVRAKGETLPRVPTEVTPPLSFQNLKQLVQSLKDSDTETRGGDLSVASASSAKPRPPSMEAFKPENIVNVTRTPPELVYAAKMIAEGPRKFPDWEKPEVVKAEIRKTADALWRAVRENPDQLNLKMVDKTDFLKDLCTLSYPIIADLLESVNSLAEPLTSADLDPSLPKMVSVMADPFGIYKEGVDPPDTGAIVFVKRKNKVRGLQPRPEPLEKPVRAAPPPESSAVTPKGATPLCGPVDKDDTPPPNLKSASVLAKLAAISKTGYAGRQEGADRQQVRDQLMELMAQALVDEEDEDEATLDYNFLSIESTHLPPTVRALVEKGRGRGEELETVIINRRDYLEMVKTVRAIGVPHDQVRHHDTESIVCFPSELQMDNCMFDPEKAFEPKEDDKIGHGVVEKYLEPPPAESAPAEPDPEEEIYEISDAEARFIAQDDVPMVRRMGP